MGLRERLHDLAKSPVEHQADSLREQSETAGGDDLTGPRPAASGLCLRHRCARSPCRRGAACPLVAEVWTATGRSTWSGWAGRTIGGIEPGVFLRATGRVTSVRGTPTIFNPAYEIVPTT